MSTTRRMVYSLLYSAGMFFLGLFSGFLLPISPVFCGVLVALSVFLSLKVGVFAACAGAATYCAGIALLLLVLDPALVLSSVWVFVLLAGTTVLIHHQLRGKVPATQVMQQAGLAVVIYGTVSYLLLQFLAGDLITWLTGKISEVLQSMQEGSPQLLDYMLSTWSCMGVLPDVGLSEPVLSLDAAIRKELTSSFLESMDLSMRRNIISLLTQTAVQMAALGTLIPALAYRNREPGKEITEIQSPEMFRISSKLNLLLMSCVLLLWVIFFFGADIYSIYLAFWKLVQFIYGLQGLSVCEWFLKKHGWKAGWRALTLGAAYLILPTILFFIGFLEQIFYFRNIGKPKPEDFEIRDPDDREDDR